MDRITKSLLDEFVTQNSLQSLPEERAFEHFAGYLVTSSHFSETFSTGDIQVGDGNDCVIDSISIIVNGCLVTEPEEIQDLVDTNGYLDVTFVFVQAERSSSFETAKIGQFGFGVQDFFSNSPALPQNEQVQLKTMVLNEIFLRSSRFRKGNPQCYLYYVTTGRWVDDQNLTVRRDAVIKDLKDLNLFRRVIFECIDAERIHGLYRDTKNSITKEIVFTARTVVPDIPGIEQAYLGFLPVPEFLKLIENNNEEVISSIFYDNVRHWQEWNEVNTEMKETLEDADTQLCFPLFNNGVTIVAKQITPTGNRFVI